MKLLFHPLARKEFEISANWYKERSIKVEKRFVESVFETIDFIANNPKVVQKIQREKRAARVTGFPFSILYIVDSDSVFIISVFHHSRNPKIWKNR